LRVTPRALLLVLLAGCSDDGGANAVAHDAAIAKRDARVDPSSAPASGIDASATFDAGDAAPPRAECVPGTQYAEVCEQPHPGCTTGGGYALATCQPDGTHGPCECLPSSEPLEPPSAADTTACLEVGSAFFASQCAECVCDDSKVCAQAVARCDGDCAQLTLCLGSCLPDGGADFDCITKCLFAFPPEAVTRFGMAVPNCVARCPDACLTDFQINISDPDADGGAP
jgi:hypothetical protein